MSITPASVEQWVSRLEEETGLLKDCKGRVKGSNDIIAQLQKEGADQSQISGENRRLDMHRQAVAGEKQRVAELIAHLSQASSFPVYSELPSQLRERVSTAIREAEHASK